MQLYEICKADLLLKYKNNYKAAINAQEYILRDDNFVKNAFNFGHGTTKDMNRYMKDNCIYCIWIDAYTMQPATTQQTIKREVKNNVINRA